MPYQKQPESAYNERNEENKTDAPEGVPQRRG